jgi:hypothetical protein
MLFPRYVSCPLFVHSQLYLTPLTLSGPLLLHTSIECFRQFSAPVLFLFHSISAKYLVGERIVRLRRIFLVPVSMGNVVCVAWCARILTRDWLYAIRVKSYNPLFRMVFLLYGI